MPVDDGLQEIRDAATTWAASRKPLAQGFNKDGLRGFVEKSDAMARRVIHGLDIHDPEALDALAELCTIGSTILAQGKVFVGRQDRTPPR